MKSTYISYLSHCLDPIYEYNPLKFLPRKRYFTINGTNAIELSNEYCFHANTTQTLAQYHYEAWYQNGTYISINNAKYNSTVIIKQNGELIFTIEISNVSGTDQGNYVGIISGRINDLTRWCNEYRYSFLPYSYRFFYHYDLPIAISYSSIEVYSKCIVILAYYIIHNCNIIAMLAL